MSFPEPQILVDGQLRPASNGGVYPNWNPATEELLGDAADATIHDAAEAVAAARRAFDESDWASDGALRRECLGQLLSALRDEADSSRGIVVAEAGSPVSLTYATQHDVPLADAEWDIGCIDRIPTEVELPPHEFFGMKSRRLVLREPVGVVAAITPWNFPFLLNLTKIFPALAAGNTVVLKAAPDTPWSATHIARIVHERTDIPPGVLNVLTSQDPSTVGAALVRDPKVDMVSFTGSTAVGKEIMAVGAGTMKRLFLELGGKSAHIVLDDADFEDVARSAPTACLHAGQGCAITSRMLVPRQHHDELVELMIRAFALWRYGDPTNSFVLQGPLINERQQRRVLSYIETAVAEGAEIAHGGGVPGHLRKGWYVEPTLLTNVKSQDTIAQEEVFGPVLCVLPYDDEEEAIAIANDSKYGLSGAVSSASEERAFGVARKIRTGSVSVNNGQWYGPDSPFGGVKESGIGREHGEEGFLQYLQTKTVGVPAH